MAARGRTWAALLASRGSDEQASGYFWDQSGVPRRFRGFRLESHPGMAGPSRSALCRMAGQGRGASWFLWGEVGRGKTGAAVGIAWLWVDPILGRPRQVVYWSLPDLLGRMRASYDREGQRGGAPADAEWELIERCRNADLLVLDDLGVEGCGRADWVESRLLLTVGWRHDEGLAMVVTSNLSPSELAPLIGERVACRIVESCGAENVVHLVGEDLRAQGWTED